ncbi:MAG TPA: DMT family transporter [Acidobacteriota bacterium]|nr:DMT family transporter [Acidobacteriota bacterium]
MQIFVFVLLCFIWSSSWIGIKFSLQGFPPFLGAGLRFSLAVSFLAIFVWRRRGHLRLERRYWWPLLVTGLLTYVWDYGLIYWAQQHLNPGVTAVLFATFPLFTAAAAIFVYRIESFRGGVLVGMLLGLAGVAAIFAPDLVRARLQGMAPWAGLAVLAGASGGALGIGLTKLRLSRLDPALLTFYQMLPGATGLLLLGWLSGETVDWPVPAVSWWAVLYLAAAASALAFSLYYWLLQSFHATTMSLIIYVTPVLALLLDWIVFGITPSWGVAVGVVLIFSGIFIAEWPKRRQARRAKLQAG